MKKACMLLYSYYPDDPRMRRGVDALLRDGWQVDVVCLRHPGAAPLESCHGAMVYRVGMRRHKGDGAARFLIAYMLFCAIAGWRLAALYLRRRYDVVQVQNLPDFLVFAALVPRLFGARVVLDIRDLVPELYMVKYAGLPDHPAVLVMRWIERWSAAFAHHVLTASEPFRQRLIERGIPPDKLTMIMNGADAQLFSPLGNPPAAAAAPTLPPWERGQGDEGQSGFTLIYHGTLAQRYGLDIAIRAVERLRDSIPGLQLQIYGSGEEAVNLENLVRQLGLAGHVRLGGFVPIDAIPQLIAAADLGVVPMRQNLFTDLAHSTKAFEYIVMGIPVIVSHTRAMAELFPSVPDMFFRPDDVEDLAQHILALYRDPTRRRRLLAAARQAYGGYTWEIKGQEYLDLMHRLAMRAGQAPKLEQY